MYVDAGMAVQSNLVQYLNMGRSYTYQLNLILRSMWMLEWLFNSILYNI